MSTTPFVDIVIHSHSTDPNITEFNTFKFLKSNTRGSSLRCTFKAYEIHNPSWTTYYAREPLTPSKNKFTIKLDKVVVSRNSWDFAIGVTKMPKYKEENQSSCAVVGWELNEWGYVGASGLVISHGEKNENRKEYGPKLKAGDIITVVVGFYDRTIQYIVNGKELGIAHSDVTFDQPLFPSVSSISKTFKFSVLIR
jgi:hypothetical protein